MKKFHLIKALPIIRQSQDEMCIIEQVRAMQAESPGTGNYTEERRELLKDWTVDVVEEIRKKRAEKG